MEPDTRPGRPRVLLIILVLIILAAVAILALVRGCPPIPVPASEPDPEHDQVRGPQHPVAPTPQIPTPRA